MLGYCREIPYPLLQWGRDEFIAEIMSCRIVEFVTGLLQWGRDEFIAEMVADSTKLATGGGFNGAAMNSSRKFGCVDWINPAQ